MKLSVYEAETLDFILTFWVEEAQKREDGDNDLDEEGKSNLQNAESLLRKIRRE